MLRLRNAAALALAAAMAGAVAAQDPSAGPCRFARENVLGTSMDLAVFGAAPAVAERVEAAVLAEIERLDGVLSSWNETSEFSQFVRSSGEVHLSEDLFAVLATVDDWCERTHGAFDPAFGRRGAATDDGSDKGSVEGAENGRGPILAGSPWRLDAEASTGRMVYRGEVRIAGLAKGYVIERAVTAGLAVDASVTGILLDVGGDLLVRGAVDEAVRITDPSAPADNAAALLVLQVRDAAVATSGGYARPIPVHESTADGQAQTQEASHIIDPATGKPVEQVLSATVIAADCVSADALATALNVLAPRDGLALVESLSHCECVIVDRPGTVYRSSGISSLLGPIAAGAPIQPQPIHRAGIEMALTFTIRAPDSSDRRGRRSYRRPYVAAWIEDQATGEPVRTLCLWIEGRRWLRDLRTWYRIHRDERELIDTVSRATRKPGQYQLVWDGRDDAGERLETGNYVVCLEVAREHGSHQYMRHPVSLTDRGTVIHLESNEEVETGTIEVRCPYADRGGSESR